MDPEKTPEVEQFERELDESLRTFDDAAQQTEERANKLAAQLIDTKAGTQAELEAIEKDVQTFGEDNAGQIQSVVLRGLEAEVGTDKDKIGEDDTENEPA